MVSLTLAGRSGRRQGQWTDFDLQFDHQIRADLGKSGQARALFRTELRVLPPTCIPF